jgi:exonuclease III
MAPVKIVAWNLNHRASEGRLKAKLTEAVARLNPDLLVLNEYVHGETRTAFVESLGAIGLRHLQVSVRLNSNNQVLIASRQPIELGDLLGPRMHDDGGTSNFLHIKVSGTDVELVGVRAPAYKASADLRDYWRQLRATIQAATTRQIAFIGDLNADPNRKRGIGDKHLAELRVEGWIIPEAVGAWSYASGTRIDHVVLSPSFGQASAEYVCRLEELVLAGRGNRAALSDHAALVVLVSDAPRNAVQQQVSADVVASASLWQRRG